MTSVLLGQTLIAAIRRHGDRVALVTPAGRMTYAALDAASDRLAGFLRAEGVGQGDAVALLMRNRAEYAVADIAILKLGAVKVPLNELMAVEEARYCIAHSGAGVLIAEDDLAPAILADGDLRLRLSVERTSALANVAGWQMVDDAAPLAETTDCAAGDPALIMYTGGTTGRPKGVRHVQGGLGACMLAHVVCGEIGADEVMLLSSPLPHSAGFFLQACFLQGGTACLPGRFDAAAVLPLAIDQGVTWTFAVPTMLYRLFDEAEKTGLRPAFRTIIYGAAPMGKERLQQGIALFGPVFIQLYGQSESPNFITTLSKADHGDEGRLTSCGRPVPFARVRLCDDAGKAVANGEVGEIWAHTPYVMTGYLNDPETSAKTLEDGWLRTGDLARADAEGYLFLVDRAKDMIISGGFNIYSVEVEAALRRHPSVGDVAVVGLPDADWGERVVALVTPAGPLDPDALRQFARGELSAYKVPKDIFPIDALPLTKFGKVDKKALRQALQDGALIPNPA